MVTLKAEFSLGQASLNGKRQNRMQKLEITAEQFAEHRKRFPARNPDGAMTDELEIKLWNEFLNSDDPSVAREASKLARAYGLHPVKTDSGR